ncbi:OmpA family protein [Pararhodobacter sp. SW119]|uniref:OmpA family protein n=1 Tax=Pararhodobacter sp. SW119 TaxID=2780075 RepID=UPI001ADF0DB4|nr:OmpA family protein [Pararhodobacter sp. SW119]
MTLADFRLPVLLGYALAACLVVGAPLPASAQDAAELSESQLEELFRTQRTRGLVLAPAAGGATQQPEQGVTTTSADDYVQLDRAEQVNIRISFDFDSSALRDDQKPRLQALCNVMREIDIERFRIIGHTDAVGSAAYNQRLSLMRAEEVKRHLVGECGIDSARLEAIGVGPDYLYDPEDPRSPENRRVEFQAMS